VIAGILLGIVAGLLANELCVLRRFPLPVIGGTLGTRIAAWWQYQLVSASRRAGRGAAAAGWLGSSARRW
jgi:hypothetical protein